MFTNEQLLEELNKKFFGNKSLFTDSDLSSGGLLNDKQLNQFIDETLERAVMRKECRHESGAEKTFDLDKIEFAEPSVESKKAMSQLNEVHQQIIDNITLKPLTPEYMRSHSQDIKDILA